MREIFDVEAVRIVLMDSATELGGTLARFLPALVASVVILIIGWVVSRIAEIVIGRTLRRLGLDRVTATLHVSETIRQAGLKSSPSQIVARLVFWVLMLTFVLSAAETLGLTAATATIDRLIAYLPSVIGAGLIVVVGLLAGRLVRNLVTSGAAAANVSESNRLGAAANGVVVLVAGVLAMEELGVETQILVTVITVVIATLGIAMGAAFALGARPVVTHILAGHFLRKSLPNGRMVEIRGRRGEVERVGPVDTLFRDGEQSWSIPNAQLLDETVIR